MTKNPNPFLTFVHTSGTWTVNVNVKDKRRIRIYRRSGWWREVME